MTKGTRTTSAPHGNQKQRRNVTSRNLPVDVTDESAEASPLGTPVSSRPSLPHYEAVLHAMTVHGDTREDPFFYFRDKKNPKIKKWLRQETASAKAALDHLCNQAHLNVARLTLTQQHEQHQQQLDPNDFKDLETRIYTEMKARWKETDASLPSKERHYWYLTRTREGKEHPYFTRIPVQGHEDLLFEFAALLKSHPDADIPIMDDEMLLLNVNTLRRDLDTFEAHQAHHEGSSPTTRVASVAAAEGNETGYIEVGDLDISDDETKCLVSVDISDGQEIFAILLLDLTGDHAVRLRDAWREEDELEANTASTTQSAATSSKRTRRSLAVSQRHRRSAPPVHRHGIQRVIEAFPASSEVLWCGDHAFLYFALDDSQRPFRVIFHDLSVADVHSEEADIIIYEERDVEFWLGSLCFTEDESHIAFCSASKLSEEWHVVDIQQQSMTSRVAAAAAKQLQDIGTLEVTTTSTEDADGAAAVPLNIFSVFQERQPKVEYDLSRIHCSLVTTTTQSSSEAKEDHDKVPPPAAGTWLRLSNRDECHNFTLDFAPAASIGSKGPLWQRLFEYVPGIKLDSVFCSKSFLLINARRDGFPTAFVASHRWLRQRLANGQGGGVLDINRDTVCLQDVIASHITATPPAQHDKHPAMPKDPFCLDALSRRQDDWRVVFSVEASMGTDDYDCREIRVFLHHPVFPGRVYLVRYTGPQDEGDHDHDAAPPIPLLSAMDDFGDVFLLRSEFVKGKPFYDPSQYAVKRVWVPSSTTPTVTIPMTVVYHTELFQEGQNPCLITAYGSYGDSTDPEFSAERLSLLNRGVVYAVANVRGGGELGRLWRDAGRMLHRKNTFTDFVDCSRALIDRQFCHPGRLAALGGSAGGTVVAAALIIAPELYRSVLPLVPFVDCLTTMLDPSIPLTTAEWEEWGNPVEDAEAYHYIKSYAPMEQVDSLLTAPKLPAYVFIESGYGDPRVPYWEPMAFTARLRNIAEKWRQNTDASAGAPVMQVLHKCNVAAGHAGASGRYEQLQELAGEYAFVVASLYA